METVQNTLVARESSGWRKSDTVWMLGLYGTAIGAGVLFVARRFFLHGNAKNYAEKEFNNMHSAKIISEDFACVNILAERLDRKLLTRHLILTMRHSNTH